MMTTDEVVVELKKAGITESKQVVLRFVREGRLQGKILTRKRGYRFKKEDVETFISDYFKEDSLSPLQELERLKEENKQLKEQLAYPKEYWIVENRRLAKALQEQEETVKELREELFQASTIRIQL
ncbi:hypothetical protein IMZ31_20060 (plasmid) [Pontibacillus sp. ALD_SL1]|uniref:hypothetical protein n=1 Tax=Pontibacillus sp. ALD_SL1 TaxID=2777185 RepID=UPI001A96D3DA|nr:hypothetical protein [Pontibacillus sp. ALD_SL1]QST02847.1 hypothetical protein IMZ31_20060 [Pontibacillus sp. ALD_SL1]